MLLLQEIETSSAKGVQQSSTTYTILSLREGNIGGFLYIVAWKNKEDWGDGCVQNVTHKLI
jgi:hypothetical protein